MNETPFPPYPSPTPNTQTPNPQPPTNLNQTATMHPTTLILSSLCLASTALAAPPLPLTKRQIYTIDGKPNTDYNIDHEENGRPIPPEDFPYYDSLPHMQCQAHINYVPRIGRGTWKEECPPSMLL